jgi:protein-L-isoaspartate(D-aspartate) O-methyltransferase
MVIPVGQRYQQTMYLFTKKKGKLEPEALQPTFFVPMTGAAEDRRQVKPDPANPRIANGGFEQIDDLTKLPVAWYYAHQMEVTSDQLAPAGKVFVQFSNTQPGRTSQALQGFAIDGRKVHQIDVSCRVRAQDVRLGESRDQTPVLGITYFDERRAPCGESLMPAAGRWTGSFDWQRETARLAVPQKAREASIRIGLFGATGKLSLDEIELKPASDSQPPKR